MKRVCGFEWEFQTGYKGLIRCNIYKEEQDFMHQDVMKIQVQKHATDYNVS